MIDLWFNLTVISGGLSSYESEARMRLAAGGGAGSERPYEGVTSYFHLLNRIWLTYFWYLKSK